MKPAKQKDMQLLDALKRIQDIVPTSDPDEEPAWFVRDLTRSWKKRGGKSGGKPRHSDRYLGELLKGQGTPIKSLTPKLKGTTRLQPDEAGALIYLILSCWTYKGEASDQSIDGKNQYEALFDENLISEISTYIKKKVASSGPDTEEEAASTTESSGLGDVTPILLESQFRQSDALFTVSSGQTLIVPPDPRHALKGFRDIIQKFWFVERSDKKGRLLAWILDYTIWGWEERDFGSRLRFMNVQALITRFKALRKFPERPIVAEERWDWLQSNAVIILYGMAPPKSEGPQGQLEPELARIQQHHILFSALPDAWAKSPNFYALYGSRLERQDQATYSIFACRSRESASSNSPSAVDQALELSYFAHAQIESDGKNEARSLDLDAPGWSFEVAYRYVYAAAVHFLGPSNASRQPIKGGDRAMEGLQQLGFSFLTPDDFIKL